MRVAGDGVELPREGRRLEEDEDDGEEDEERVREHHPEAVEEVSGELEDPGGIDVVEDAGAVLRELDAEPAQGPDERAELPLQPLGVARKVVGEVVDRGADDDREPEQHSDHREDDREEGDSAGKSACLQPEDERRADDRDEDREQEGVDERLGRFQPRHHDDERGRREEDGLEPGGMVLRGVHRAERCRSRARDATGGWAAGGSPASAEA